MDLPWSSKLHPEILLFQKRIRLPKQFLYDPWILSIWIISANYKHTWSSLCVASICCTFPSFIHQDFVLYLTNQVYRVSRCFERWIVPAINEMGWELFEESRYFSKQKQEQRCFPAWSSCCIKWMDTFVAPSQPQISGALFSSLFPQTECLSRQNKSSVVYQRGVLVASKQEQEQRCLPACQGFNNDISVNTQS